MATLPPINKQLGRGRPRTAVNKSELPKKVSMSDKVTLGELPKKIIGSHMGYMQTGGSETPPSPNKPALGKPPQLPPRVRKGPPKI